jgi:spermidine synthase
MSSSRTTPASTVGSQAYLPLLVLLFIGSGFAALIYEIVWLQMLSLIVGSSAISLGVLLGTFMGGMCIGSLLLPRYIPPGQHPLRVYGLLEAGIAGFGILMLVLLPVAGGLYTAIGGPGMLGLFVRGLFCAICLLPPTILMGATLPAIARWVETTPRGVSWLGFFYGGNIVGAVIGCLVAGFYLLRVHDVTTATLVAAVANIVVAAAGIGLSRTTPYTPPAAQSSKAEPVAASGAWSIYATITLSGMSALGAEVVWTRLLSLMLGATVYTFSLILATFLIGLGIGSSVGAVLARSLKNPRAALAWCQLLLTAGIAWAAWMMTEVLPYWPVNPQLPTNPVFIFQLDFTRSLWTVLPAACLWGASFPLALASVAARGRDPGRLVGTVYAANTVGGIVGAMMASLVLIPALGTQQSERILIALAALSAVIAGLVAWRETVGVLKAQVRGAAWAVLAVALAAMFGSGIVPVPPILVAYGRYAVTWLDSHGEFIFVGEGMNSSMAVSRLSNGVLNYHNAGKVQASSEPQDMRLQRMLGHLTTLVPKSPKRVLVIGCGAGVTAGAVSISPAVEHVTIAEIEKLVPFVVSTYFAEHNYDVVRNPKVQVQVDDARHFLLTTKEKFDAITSDPFDPWVKGAATLYTKEFFEVMKQHLNPGGVVTVFVQLYESGMPAVKSEIATFLEAFPNGMVFGNTHRGGGYDVVLLGQVEPTKIDLDEMDRKLTSPEYAQVAQSLGEIGFTSAVDLLGTWAGEGSTLKPWLADAQVNRDRNLRLQYLAGMGLNKYEQALIYQQILSYRRPPIGIFSGSPERLQALSAVMTDVR